MYEIAYLTKILLVQFILQLKNWLTTVILLGNYNLGAKNAYFKCVFMTKLFIKALVAKNCIKMILELFLFFKLDFMLCCGQIILLKVERTDKINSCSV